MQNQDSSFMVHVRRTIDRTCLLALFIVVLAISPLMAISEARAELITFDEYPQDTPITDQYQNRGVIFSGEPESPVIYPPWWYEPAKDEPTLMGCPLPTPPWGSGSIIVTFVDPIDVTPVEAINVDFYYYWLSRLGSDPVTITYYDLNGDIISEANLQEDPDPRIPSTLHKFVITTQTTGTGNYFHIDDLSFQTLPHHQHSLIPVPARIVRAWRASRSM